MTITRFLGRCVKHARRGTLQLNNDKGLLFANMTASRNFSLDLGGIYPPIATPFNKDESIAYDKLADNMGKWNSIPFKGYVVQGSNGEYAYLRQEERIEMVRQVSQIANKGQVIMAGAGCESTRDTILVTEAMTKAGANVVLIVTPCYYKGAMNNAALIDHYTKVANASPVPVVLYSVPANTNIEIPPEVVIHLAQHPNIIGLKDSGGDISRIGYLVYKTKDLDFQILAGSAGFLLPAYSIGCVGGVCALGNMLGQHLCDLEKLFMENKMEEAKTLQQRLIGPNTFVTKKFGVPGLKAAMEMMGYFGGPTRSPLQPLSESELNVLTDMFKTTGFV